jgi:hypothetical protein
MSRRWEGREGSLTVRDGKSGSKVLRGILGRHKLGGWLFRRVIWNLPNMTFPAPMKTTLKSSEPAMSVVLCVRIRRRQIALHAVDKG